MTDLSALRGAIAGEVLLPGDRDYELRYKPPIARFHDIRPAAIVPCGTPTDVAEALSLVRRSGLESATRSGGHCFAGRSSTRGILIDVGPMGAVSVSDGMATVGAGARLGDVYDALAEHGLTIAGGCGPTVGIAGLTLGGGLGILGRRHGLTCDQLDGAEVVLADGRVVHCDQERHGDLLWALRGAGGGTFGVVTSLRFRTLPAPAATNLHLVWPQGQAAAVVEAWQSWAPDGPDELAASLLLTAAGDAGQPARVHVFGAMLGTEADTVEQLDALVARAGAEPASASVKQLPYRDAKRDLAEHGPGEDLLQEPSAERPPPPGHSFSKSEFFRRPLPAEAVTALVEGFAAGRAAGQARTLDFTPWGGAYNRVPADATAFVHRDERFLLKQEVVVRADASAAERLAALDWLSRSWSLVHPWGSGGVYPNFPDPDLEDPARAYYGSNLDRLLAIKAKYDPTGLFHSL